MSSFTKALSQKLLSFSAVLTTLLIALLYITLSAVVLNFRLFFIYPSPLIFKLHILINILLGLGTTMNTLDFFLLILSSLLVGINGFLILKSLRIYEKQGNMRFAVGGATVISFVATGCASCGLSVLSLFGLSSAVSILPFHGLEIHIISITLLLFSAWYLLRNLHDSKSCRIK